MTLQSQLMTLKAESATVGENLEQAQKSLMIANESLQRHEKEVKQEENRLTWQRNIAGLVAVVLVLR